MEKVAKFFIPQGLTQFPVTPGAGTTQIGSTAYNLPQTTFPMQPGYFAQFKYANLYVNQPAGSLAVGNIYSGFLRLQSTIATVEFPCFPVAPSNIFTSNPPGGMQIIYPCLPPPIWEFDDFMTVGLNPIAVTGIAVVNLSTSGALSVAISGLLEVWKQ